jgi:hypothetical protein
MTTETTPSGIIVEFRQHDWQPGFASYLAREDGLFEPNGPAFCTINLEAFLATRDAHGDDQAGFVASIADTMVHEVIHVIEAWAGVEFSEQRVEELIARYRGVESPYQGDDGMDFGQALYLAQHEARTVRSRSAPSSHYRVHESVFQRNDGTGWYRGSPDPEDLGRSDWEVVS